MVLSIIYCFAFHPRTGNVTESLLEEGENVADYQPHVEERCPTNQEHVTLDPNKRCKDRFYLTENGTLILNHPQDDYQGVYRSEEFCIQIDGNAKTKDEHLPRICLDTAQRKLRMK